MHIYLPFMGTFSKDTYETASQAALVGGTTTIIEMVCPSRDMSAAGRLSSFGMSKRPESRLRFHLSHGRDAFDDENAAQLREIVKARHLHRSKSSSPTKARSASTTPSSITR